MTIPLTLKLFALQVALCDAAVTRADALVLTVLIEFHNADQGAAWPSVELIADVADLKERTVQKAIRRLEARGLVTVETGGGHGRSSRYTIVWPDAPPLKPRIEAATAKLQAKRVNGRTGFRDAKGRTPGQGSDLQKGEQSRPKTVNGDDKKGERQDTRTLLKEPGLSEPALNEPDLNIKKKGAFGAIDFRKQLEGATVTELLDEIERNWRSGQRVCPEELEPLIQHLDSEQWYLSDSDPEHGRLKRVIAELRERGG